jgi:predicted anti-sigma-YlaC factor YlaD
MPQSAPDNGHVQELLGVYLLGGMSDPDAAAVRAHLDVCQDCRDEHDYLAIVPEWLNMVKDSAAGRPRLRLIADHRGQSPQ